MSHLLTVTTELWLQKKISHWTYGGGAKAGGAFVTTCPAGNRINAKIYTALVPD